MAKRKASADINRPLSVTVTATGAPASGGGGGGTLPGTLTGATGNTVVGGRHYHAIQLAHEHLLNVGAEDHHPLVTPGNTAIGVSGQAVSLNLAAISGMEVSSGLRLADSIAGDGLSIANKVLAVGVSGLGLSVGADAVTLTSSSNPGAAASILASDANGYLQLTRIGLNHAPDYPLHVAGATQQVRVDYNDSNYLSLTVGSDGAATLATVGASGNLNLNPGGDVVFDPTGNDLLPATGYDLNLGSLQRKYLTLHAAELWVETLVAQDTIATIGGRILVGPTTTLTSDVSAGQDFIIVKHNEMAYGDRVYLEADGKVEFLSVGGWAILETNPVGEWVRIQHNYTWLFTAGRYITISGSPANDGEWLISAYLGGSEYDAVNNWTTIYISGDVTGYTGGGRILYVGQQGVGPYTYNVGRNLDGSGAKEWYAGDAVFNTGQAGDGFIDLYSVRGVRSGDGPTIVGNVRNSATYNDWSPAWAIGNLNGIYGYGATTMGAAFGRYANNSSFLTADATNGIRILKRASGANTVLGQWAMDGAITIGEVAASKSNVLISAGAVKLRNNTTDKIVLNADGTSSFEGVMNLGASGGIFQGTGTFASPTAGMKLWNATGIGHLGFWADSYEHTLINDRGISIKGSFTTIQDYSGIRWLATPPTGEAVGRIVAGLFYSSLHPEMRIESNYESDYAIGRVNIVGQGDTSDTYALMHLTSSANASLIELQAFLDGDRSEVQLGSEDAGAFFRVVLNTTNVLQSNSAGTTISGGLNVGTATGAGAGEARASAFTVNTKRTCFAGTKTIADNTATGVFRVTAADKKDAVLLVTALARSTADAGYVVTGGRWLVALRWNSTSSAGSAVTSLGTVDSGSANGSFADVGVPALTVTNDAANKRFTINVQADHTGSWGNGQNLTCAYEVELLSEDTANWTFTAL